MVFKKPKGSAVAFVTALVREQLKYSALSYCRHFEKRVKVWERIQKGWKENPGKDGLVGLIILAKYFPMRSKKNLRSVPPGRHEFGFGSCPGEFKLLSPSPVRVPQMPW